MAARNLLHKDRVEEFRVWCEEAKGLETRPGRGAYQLLQVKSKNGNDWHVIFERDNMPEHVTVPDTLIHLVTNFIRSTK